MIIFKINIYIYYRKLNNNKIKFIDPALQDLSQLQVL